MTTRTTELPRRLIFATVAIAAGIPLVLFSGTFMAISAAPYIDAGTLPDDPYVRKYVQHPVPALLHVIPGLVFMVGALFQLSAQFRRRHLVLHRRMGRVILTAGLVSATWAIYIGIDHPYGGFAETSATVVFASWMMWSLVAAFLAIRRRDVKQHRRWMIRAFVVALGISTIRLWTVVLGDGMDALRTGEVTDITTPQAATYGLAFWLGFSMHVAFAEWWLRQPRKKVDKPT